MKKYILSVSLIVVFIAYSFFWRAHGGSAIYIASAPIDREDKNGASSAVASSVSGSAAAILPDKSISVAPPAVSNEDNDYYREEDDEDGEDEGRVVKPPSVAVISQSTGSAQTKTQTQKNLLPSSSQGLGTITPTSKVSPVSSAVSGGQYKDGKYTGSVADAYYGNIQVQAVVAGGKLSDVIFLQYPNDRSTSIRINQQAMPYLKQEAIAAQSAAVDTISGATDSSGAFRQSLVVALAQAKN